MSGEAYIMAGGLPGQKFKLAQFHLHWGSDLSQGSEHTYNGEFFPAEVVCLLACLFLYLTQGALSMSWLIQ